MSSVSFGAIVKPIGVNAAYTPARWGRRHGFRKTPEARLYQDLLTVAARQAMRGRRPFAGSLAAKLTFVHADNRSDIDGPIKPTLDALEGVVYANDRQVRHLWVEYLVGEVPGVQVLVWEVTP